MTLVDARRRAAPASNPDRRENSDALASARSWSEEIREGRGDVAPTPRGRAPGPRGATKLWKSRSRRLLRVGWLALGATADALPRSAPRQNAGTGGAAPDRDKLSMLGAPRGPLVPPWWGKNVSEFITVIPGLAKREPGTHDRVIRVELDRGFRARTFVRPRNDECRQTRLRVLSERSHFSAWVTISLRSSCRGRQPTLADAAARATMAPDRLVGAATQRTGKSTPDTA